MKVKTCDCFGKGDSNVLQSENPYLMYFESWPNGKHMKL